jgi:hypothetical protein
VFLGTIHRDGGPRINPIEAHFVEGQLAHSLISGSVPILDAASGEPGEFKVRATAHPVEHTTLRSAIQDAVEARSSWRPPHDWHFFTMAVDAAVYHDYDPQADVHHVKRWTPDRGYEAWTRKLTS